MKKFEAEAGFTLSRVGRISAHAHGATSRRNPAVNACAFHTYPLAYPCVPSDTTPPRFVFKICNIAVELVQQLSRENPNFDTDTRHTHSSRFLSLPPGGSHVSIIHPHPRAGRSRLHRARGALLPPQATGGRHAPRRGLGRPRGRSREPERRGTDVGRSPGLRYRVHQNEAGF